MKPAGVPKAVRPLPGLRLKINLLLLAIQVPALCILAFSSTRGIEELVRQMARSQAEDLAGELHKRLAVHVNRLEQREPQAEKPTGAPPRRPEPRPEEALEEELRGFLEFMTGVRAASVFLAEEGQLRSKAHWGEGGPREPDEEDSSAFLGGRTVSQALEQPQPTLAMVHRPLRSAGGRVVGVIRLELDQAANAAQVRSYQRQLFVGMVVIFGLTVLVLFGGMHLLVVSPVKRLVRAMVRVHEGKLEPVDEGTSRDEIGSLARSYNEMVQRLRFVLRRLRAVLGEKENLLGEVRDLNQNLTRRVEDATRDLAKSHNELESAYHDLYASQRDRERLQGLASLGQVAREIAHEFATPLNVVSGTLQMLLEDPELQAQHRERLARLLAQTERLIQICRDTLSPLKLPAPDLRPSDLNALVEEVGAFMAPALAARRVEFRTRLAAELPEVRADLHQIEQVLLNLISNALDALPSGGHIEVETGVEPGAAKPVFLSVRDDGVGIPPDHLQRIFDPFFSTKGAGRGTGLGLAICKEIVGQHGGEIRIESAPGRGSRVTLRLPAAGRIGEAAA